MATIQDYFQANPSIMTSQPDHLTCSWQINSTLTGQESGISRNFILEAKLHWHYSANVTYWSYFIPLNADSFVNPIDVMKALIDQQVQATHPYQLIPEPFKSQWYNFTFQGNKSARPQSSDNLRSAYQVVFFVDEVLSEEQKSMIYSYGDSKGLFVQVKDKQYAEYEDMIAQPVAFISHDSRDKPTIARPLAAKLAQIVGPVWFDEYSLKIGDNLRESVEKGIKECRRCILVVTPNFLSNTGWTKREFDAVFTKEIIEDRDAMLPIWSGVKHSDVYEYSSTLAGKFALNWDEGVDAIAYKIEHAIKMAAK